MVRNSSKVMFPLSVLGREKTEIKWGRKKGRRQKDENREKKKDKREKKGKRRGIKGGMCQGGTRACNSYYGALGISDHGALGTLPPPHFTF